MTMICGIKQIKMSFGDRDILEDITMSIAEGERIGLVGGNGCGKTTLVRILLGELEASGGRVEWYTKQIRFGYLKQDLVYNEDTDSGGEKMKKALQEIWEDQANFLILDEPTNHLDDKGVSWLLKRLKSFQGTVLVISHDRYFLDQYVQRIVEIEKGKVSSYEGNYSSYRDEKKRRFEAQRNAYENQEAYKKDIAQQIRVLKQWSQKAHRESTIKAKMSGPTMGKKEYYRAKAKKKDTQIKSRIKRLEKIEVEGLKRPDEEKEVYFNLQETALKGKRVMEVDNLAKSYGKKVLFEKSSFYLLRGDKVGIWGVNGCGKSTLLKILQGIEYADQGEIFVSPSVKIGYYSQDLGDLDLHKKVLDLFEVHGSKELGKLRIVLDNLGIHAKMLETPLEKLSQGELSRVRIAKLIQEACDVIILDEPYNHLDLHSRERLEEVLDQYQGTLLIVSHDRYLLEKVCRQLLVFEDKKVKRLEYGLTEHLQRKNRPKAAKMTDAQRRQEELLKEFRKAAEANEMISS